ncbi:B12-binding domain-containing protein [Candidatus Magnetomoraceae bacterium gMMP-15]
MELLRNKLIKLLENWHKKGLPSRSGLKKTGQELLEWKKKEGADSLWTSSISIMTATIDDAWGHGLEIIHIYAKVLGLKIIKAGLLQSPETIINQCLSHHPDLLGLTVLQFDSEDDLKKITSAIPKNTKVIAGGPVFFGDPDFASRIGIHFVAKNVGEFIKILLDFNK